MQMFIAELSKSIDETAFRRSWTGEPGINPKFEVTFGFAGNRISASVDCNAEERWQSDSFHRTFSSAVRRVDQSCNIRWL